MAILPVFDRREVQAVMDLLWRASLTAPELNQKVVIGLGLCSTSTLYRRLSELVLAQVLEKDGGKYTVTPRGRQLYDEFRGAQHPHLTRREREILTLFRRPHSFKDVFGKVKISPNNLKVMMSEFEGQGLIRKVQDVKDTRSRGRPKRTYRITERGERAIEASLKLERKALGQE